MQLNYFAAIKLILRLLPAMREQRHGQIVNVSTAGVQMRTPRFSGYIASKAALEAFSRRRPGRGARRRRPLHDDLDAARPDADDLADQAVRGDPGANPDEAGRLVAEAISGRPRRVAPPFAHILSTVDRLSPETMDTVRNRVYRMFPE